MLLKKDTLKCLRLHSRVFWWLLLPMWHEQCSSLIFSDTVNCYHYIALPLDDWMNEYGTLVEWYRWGQTKVLRENPGPLPLFPGQITRGLEWNQTQTFMVCGQHLTVWAKVLPVYDQFWPITLAVCVLQQNRRLKCSKQLHHTIHRMSSAMAAVSHNYSLSTSSNAHSYLRKNTEMITEGTRVYMVRAMDNIHILHMCITYIQFDRFK
jgi:hypothetical protein